MFKVIVFLIGIVWASLLLVSWGGTTEAPSPRTDSTIPADSIN